MWGLTLFQICCRREYSELRVFPKIIFNFCSNLLKNVEEEPMALDGVTAPVAGTGCQARVPCAFEDHVLSQHQNAGLSKRHGTKMHDLDIPTWREKGSSHLHVFTNMNIYCLNSKPELKGMWNF